MLGQQQPVGHAQRYDEVGPQPPHVLLAMQGEHGVGEDGSDGGDVILGEADKGLVCRVFVVLDHEDTVELHTAGQAQTELPLAAGQVGEGCRVGTVTED